MKGREFNWDQYNRKKPRKKETIMPYVVILLLLFALFFLVKPALVGFSVHDTETTQTQDQEDSLVVHTRTPLHIQQLEDELLVEHTNLESCSAQNKVLIGELSKYTDKLSECSAEVATAVTQRNLAQENYESDIADLEAELRDKSIQLAKNNENDEKYIEDARLDRERAERERDEMKEDYDALLTQYNSLHSLQEDYDALGANTARNICCKARVDNPSITGYSIQDNMVFCVASGGRQLSC